MSNTPRDDAHLPITRCPHCKTAFRIRESQLAQRRGMVRCGACRGVFNAIQHMLHQAGSTITITPPPEEGVPAGYIAAPAQLNPLTLVQGVEPPNVGTPAPSPAATPPPSPAPTAPAVTLSESPAVTEATHASLPPSTPTPTPTAAPNPTPLGPALPTHEISTDELEAQLAGEEKPMDAIERVERFSTGDYEWKKPRRTQSRASAMLWTGLALVLSATLIAQIVLHWRNEIAGRISAMRPVLTQVCNWLGCRIAAPVRREDVVIDGTELVPDAAHAGLHTLSGVLRNRSAYASAYPSLVVTLTGLNNDVLTRRVFVPSEYLGARADLKNGLPGRGEMEFKVFLDASAIKPVGFDVRLSYDGVAP